jgi:hypothetical protein
MFRYVVIVSKKISRDLTSQKTSKGDLHVLLICGHPPRKYNANGTIVPYSRVWVGFSSRTVTESVKFVLVLGKFCLGAYGNYMDSRAWQSTEFLPSVMIFYCLKESDRIGNRFSV